MEILQELINYLFFPQEYNIVQQAIGPAVIPLITLALSAASTGYGMYKKGKASKEARSAMEQQNQRFDDVASWYNAEGSKDFMDTEVAQSTLGKIREQYKKGIDTNASNAARGGATAEAKVANKAALNEKYNSVLNNLVGYGTQYKSNLKKDYSNALNRVAQGQNQMYGADVASWTNQVGNSGSAFANTMGSSDWASIFGDDKKDDSAGG